MQGMQGEGAARGAGRRVGHLEHDAARCDEGHGHEEDRNRRDADAALAGRTHATRARAKFNRRV